jgi:hypothetical protein
LPSVTDFYEVEGEEAHEVAVGPVHAGIIEPGHFRFQCHGEKVLHLEISLGFQHRGVERALVGGPDNRSLRLAETLAGDTTIGHATSYCQVVEALSASTGRAAARLATSAVVVSDDGPVLALVRGRRHADEFGAGQLLEQGSRGRMVHVRVRDDRVRELQQPPRRELREGGEVEEHGAALVGEVDPRAGVAGRPVKKRGMEQRAHQSRWSASGTSEERFALAASRSTAEASRRPHGRESTSFKTRSTTTPIAPARARARTVEASTRQPASRSIGDAAAAPMRT